MGLLILIVFVLVPFLIYCAAHGNKDEKGFFKNNINICILAFWVVVALFPNWLNDKTHYSEGKSITEHRAMNIGRNFLFMPALDYQGGNPYDINETSKIDIARFATENFVMALLAGLRFVHWKYAKNRPLA